MRHVGDQLAVVIAETRAAAKQGAEEVLVDYEELPSVVAVEDAQKPGAPQIHNEAPGNTIYPGNWATAPRRRMPLRRPRMWSSSTSSTTG